MNIHYFTVFTGSSSEINNPAKGNPAGVKLVDQLPNLETHLRLIKLNPDNAHITMVYIKAITAHSFNIRWFNESRTIRRCGHGTLAATAYIHRSQKCNDQDSINYEFISDTEILLVHAYQNSYAITLPTIELSHRELPNTHSLGKTDSIEYNHNITTLFSIFDQPYRLSQTKDKQGYIIIELKDSDSITGFILDKQVIELIDQRALIITAKSHLPTSDIVFRYFAPQYGQVEDIATGSAGSVLWPFWENQFGSKKGGLRCSQLSKEGGFFQLKKGANKQVVVSGKVKIYK